MLKGISSILLLLSMLTSHSQDIADLENFEKGMKPGTQLIYNVTRGKEKYNLHVTLKKAVNEMAFVWQTDTPDGKSGNITIAPGALATSNAVYTNFNAGEIKLQDACALFISKKIFNDAGTTSQASLKLNGSSDTLTVMNNTISEFNFTMDGNLMTVPGWELQGGPGNKYTLDVFESVKFPVIFKLDIGFTMTLTEVKTK